MHSDMGSVPDPKIYHNHKQRMNEFNMWTTEIWCSWLL